MKAAIAAGMKAIGFVGASHCNSATAKRLRAAGAAAIASDSGDVARLLALA